VTTFREYRMAMAAGRQPEYELPTLPSDAIRFQGDRAGFVSRAISASIDVVIIFLLVLGTIAAWWMVSLILDPVTATPSAGDPHRIPEAGVFIVYGYALNVLYWTVGWATGGRTIGNLIMGLRVVDRHGHRVGWPGAFVRAVFCTVFAPGLLWVIVSGANRSVQDVVLRTSVIYDWVIGIPGLRRSEIPAPETDSAS
jgi:uncharacterized RDD family membrane protein YckC